MKEIGPRRSLGLDSFNRELIRSSIGVAVKVFMAGSDVDIGVGGRWFVSVS
jgi:hypothetical protein